MYMANVMSAGSGITHVADESKQAVFCTLLVS